jgi:hypothetical protein
MKYLLILWIAGMNAAPVVVDGVWTKARCERTLAAWTDSYQRASGSCVKIAGPNG